MQRLLMECSHSPLNFLLHEKSQMLKCNWFTFLFLSIPLLLLISSVIFLLFKRAEKRERIGKKGRMKDLSKGRIFNSSFFYHFSYPFPLLRFHPLTNLSSIRQIEQVYYEPLAKNTLILILSNSVNSTNSIICLNICSNKPNNNTYGYFCTVLHTIYLHD